MVRGAHGGLFGHPGGSPLATAVWASIAPAGGCLAPFWHHERFTI